MSKTVLNQGLTFRKVFMLKRRARNDRPKTIAKKEAGITDFEIALDLFFQVLRQEADCPLPGVRGIVGAVSQF
jgi:hypothetical protein